ncbi:hypothetical protein CBS63078_586 [Aspergillus niger]|nr:hypothetical protein CBS115989_2187 [Aspergillus niger]RDH18487.1 hypothetical protein M747DRAFT_343236 [Aspergillus niger ATCC 13496]KAI2831858.1 hypothetical protein CBS133816_2108 [Aspergillus niger]KAI2851855.1 hypothetical protein CBS11350_1062 [Aspergillus niger]KAI2856269.1 hypothetical protein CBS11232_3895 [Aspergillus niger]
MLHRTSTGAYPDILTSGMRDSEDRRVSPHQMRSTGILQRIVSKFIAEDARVLVLDIVEPGPEDSQGDFSNNVTYVSGDVTSPEDWQKALELVT